VKSALKLLVTRLTENDRVAIVVYAGASGVALPSTSALDRTTITAAIDGLSAQGSTNAGDGIQLAYAVAAKNFIKGGTNRIILCTDGDFNVGVTSQSELVRLIQEQARTGVFLTVLGFGMGNYKDSTMEKLADNGNGNYAYIDTQEEARKVLVDQLSGTLVTIAKDVKIQVDFNPGRAAGYRLIGYENRVLRSQDFKEDRKDAGEIGAGHTVTAIYEIVPAGRALPGADVDPSKYQRPAASTDTVVNPELLTVRLRYKAPDGAVSKPFDVPIVDESRPFNSASEDFRFAASVVEFGMLLRDSKYRGDMDFDGVLRMASDSIGLDQNGYREEFLELVKTARRLKPSRIETATRMLEVAPRYRDSQESAVQPVRAPQSKPRGTASVPPLKWDDSQEPSLLPADVLCRLAILCLLGVLLLCPGYFQKQPTPIGTD
jgi:Ca-activated chloride channel family protein